MPAPQSPASNHGSVTAAVANTHRCVTCDDCTKAGEDRSTPDCCQNTSTFALVLGYAHRASPNSLSETVRGHAVIDSGRTVVDWAPGLARSDIPLDFCGLDPLKYPAAGNKQRSSVVLVFNSYCLDTTMLHVI